MQSSAVRVPSQLVPLAVILRPHGVRGELRAKLFNPESTLLFDRERVHLRRGDQVEERRVLSCRTGGDGAALVVLEACADRDAAEGMRGVELCVPRDELPPLDDGELYLFDLPGLTARTPSGEVVGTVVRAVEYPTATCALVRGPDGDREIPLLPPYFVSIDLARGELVVDAIEDVEPEPTPRRRGESAKR